MLQEVGRTGKCRWRRTHSHQTSRHAALATPMPPPHRWRRLASACSRRYPWTQMVPLIEAKINEVCAEYYAATQDLEPHGENYAETLKRSGLGLSSSSRPRPCSLIRVRIGDRVGT